MFLTYCIHRGKKCVTVTLICVIRFCIRMCKSGTRSRGCLVYIYTLIKHVWGRFGCLQGNCLPSQLLCINMQIAVNRNLAKYLNQTMWKSRSLIDLVSQLQLYCGTNVASYTKSKRTENIFCPNCYSIMVAFGLRARGKNTFDGSLWLSFVQKLLKVSRKHFALWLQHVSGTCWASLVLKASLSNSTAAEGSTNLRVDPTMRANKQRSSCMKAMFLLSCECRLRVKFCSR